MRTRAHGNAKFVENHSSIVMVRSVDIKRQHRNLVTCFAINSYTTQFFHFFGGVIENFSLVSGNVFKSYFVHIV